MSLSYPILLEFPKFYPETPFCVKDPIHGRNGKVDAA